MSSRLTVRGKRKNFVFVVCWNFYLLFLCVLSSSFWPAEKHVVTLQLLISQESEKRTRNPYSYNLTSSEHIASTDRSSQGKWLSAPVQQLLRVHADFLAIYLSPEAMVKETNVSFRLGIWTAMLPIQTNVCKEEENKFWAVCCRYRFFSSLFFAVVFTWANRPKTCTEARSSCRYGELYFI